MTVRNAHIYLRYTCFANWLILIPMSNHIDSYGCTSAVPVDVVVYHWMTWIYLPVNLHHKCSLDAVHFFLPHRTKGDLFLCEVGFC